MENIIRIVKGIDSKLLTPKPVLQKGLTKVDPSLRWQHLYFGLFVEIKRGNICTDIEIARYLGINVNAQTYLKTKESFVDTLILTSYLLRDEISDLDRADLKYRLEQNNLNIFSLRNLLGSATVENAFKNIFKKSTRQRFSFLIARTALRLMSVYDMIAPNDKKVQYYADLYMKYEQIYLKEEILSDKYEDILIIVRTTLFGLGNISRKLNKALIVSNDILKEMDSYDLRCYDFKIRHLKALDDKSVDGLMVLCNEAIDYFGAQKMDSFEDLSIYQYQKAIIKLHIGNLEEVIKLLDVIIKPRKTKRHIRMSSQFVKLVVLFKMNRYKDAILLINKALAKNFNSEFEYDDLNEWLIYIEWIKVINNLGIYKYTKQQMNKLIRFEEMITKKENINVVDLVLSISIGDMSKSALDLISLEKQQRLKTKYDNGKRQEAFLNFIKVYIKNKGNVEKGVVLSAINIFDEVEPNYLSEYFEYETFPYEVIINALK